MCSWKGFDLEELWNEYSKSQNMSMPKFKQLVRPSSKNLNEHIKQSTRLTVVFESVSFIHNYTNVGGNPKVKIINSYDLLACRIANVG